MEVVVDGGTSKESFSSGVFEVNDLQDDTDKFEDEDATDNQQEQFVSCYERAVAHSCTERLGADISHEGLCGVAVIPEETEYGSEYSGVEDG